MQQTTLKIGGQDLFAVGKFKIYIVAVESAGVAVRVENGGKKPKDYYLKGTGKGVRLSGDVAIKLLFITEQRLADLEISHVENQAPRALKVKTGSLVFSRRRGEQVIVDKGRAVITVMALDDKRCTVHVAYSGRSFEKYLVVGEQSLAIIPKVKVEYFGAWGDNMGKLKFTAPRHIVIDRHEVHMRKEFDVSTIEEKRATYNVKKVDNRGVKTA